MNQPSATKKGRRRAIKTVAALAGAIVLAAAVLALRGRPVTPLASGTAPSPAPSGTTTYSFVHDGLTRTYDLHVPAALDRSAAAPLLIELHGGGGDASGMERLTGFDSIADRSGFVVAAPNAHGKSWNDGRDSIDTAGGTDDVGFLSEMIDRIAAQVPIDGTRVYVTGMSNGAIMSGRLACELSDRIAAVAQVAGTVAVEISGTCHPGRPVPVLQIHGTADPIVPYSGGTVLPQLGDGRGRVVSVDSWAAFWVGNNAVAAGAAPTSIGSDTTVRTWRGSTPQSDVVFYRIDGAGHTWPGGTQYLPRFIIGPTSRSFDASSVIWQFLSAHRLEK